MQEVKTVVFVSNSVQEILKRAQNGNEEGDKEVLKGTSSLPSAQPVEKQVNKQQS